MFLITWSCTWCECLYAFYSLTNISPCSCVSLAVCVYVCLGGGYKSACRRLCTVWPLSVKVESSAEAYGKPQPSPRQSTIEANSHQKPSETFFQSVSSRLHLKHPTSSFKRAWKLHFLWPFIQRCRSMLNFQNSCVVTTWSGLKPILLAHSDLGLVKKGRVAN